MRDARKQRLRVFSAVDGVEALEFFMERREPVVGVVLDLELPRVSGLQVREYLRRAHPATRMVIASGHVPTELRRDIELAGDAVIVNKPFSLATLGQALRKCRINPHRPDFEHPLKFPVIGPM